MVNQNNANRDVQLLAKYGNVSKNMAQHHHLENLSEFILHEVCYKDLFNLPKAAYFVNNPDFICLKGVAGYHSPESFAKGESWVNQHDFTSHMKNATFNQKVRSIQDKSLILGNGVESNKIHELADQLRIHDPLYHVWSMKHDNQGILIFERSQDHDLNHDHLLNFLYMLSFCPVF